MNRSIVGSGLALLLAAAPALAAPAAPADLSGLWSAKLRFGPDVSGPLWLVRDGDGWRADIAGQSVPVIIKGRELSFALPDDRGAFRGRIEGEVLNGMWLQPRTANGGPYLTPLHMRRDKRGRWRGEVVPLADEATYFVPLVRTADGYATHLRNPERNQGRFDPIRRIALDGAAVRLFGGRSGQPDRPLGNGTYDPQSDTIAFPLRGATADFHRDRSAGSGFYPRPRGERYSYRTPLALDDGWPVASLEAVGLSRPRIEAFVQKLIDTDVSSFGSSQVHSVLIARHGKLVLEEYFHGFDRETPHDIRSAGKSMTATLIGAAMRQGVSLREDTPVYAAMRGDAAAAAVDPRKRAIVLRDLMTMSSGFFCDDTNEDAPGNEDVIGDQGVDPTLYDYILDLPMAAAPGASTVYCSANALLAGGLLRKVADEPLAELFDRLIARPLDMGTYHLNLTPAGELYTAGGGYFRPRDYMKLAQLMLDGGTWRGRRILSPEWVRLAGSPLRDLNPRQQFGYFWNSAVYSWNGRQVRAVFAAGNGGQIFMEIPELDLVIAFTGGSYADAAALVPQRELVPNDILPAVLER